jgi:tetratricopeptide (TPR) repeat protein
VVVWKAARVADEWFRSPGWSPEPQADFEARLARARPYNRAQYMRIKGLALEDAGEKRGARQLWERVLESTEELATSQQASALEHLGNSYARDDSAAAENYFRRLLAEHPTLNGTSHTVEISLAVLLIDKSDRASMEEALALLNSFLQPGTSQFPSALPLASRTNPHRSGHG